MLEGVYTTPLADTTSLSVAGSVRSCILELKKSSTSQLYNDTQNDIPTHRFNVNHEGSSWSMESALALSMVDDVFKNGKAFINEIVTDDDTTMRAVVSHNKKKGRLSSDIPPPKFFADPGHRVKVMVKPIFVMVTTTRIPDDVKNLDALRLKKCTSCYIMRRRTDDFHILA